MGALGLLRGERYEINPGEEFASAPVGGPPPQMAPEGPSSAGALVPASEPRAEMPAEQAMAQPVAASQEQMGGQMPEWMDDQRKALYERGKRAAQNYRKAVDARRQRRKADREYSKLYNEFERHKGAHDHLERMQKDYPDMFRQDDPKTMGMIRQQMLHLDEAKRSRDQILNLLRKHGIKMGPKDNIPDSLFGERDDEDEKFDRFVQQGYTDAMLYRGEGRDRDY